MIAVGNYSLSFNSVSGIELIESKFAKLGFANFPTTSFNCRRKLMSTSTDLAPVKAKEDSRMSPVKTNSESNSNKAKSLDDCKGMK